MSSAPEALAQPAYKNRSGWLIAFGVAEILIGAICLSLLLLILTLPPPPAVPGAPAFTPRALAATQLATSAVFIVFAAFFILIGIGSILRRNWARITMLAVSILWLAVGVLSMIVVLAVMPSMMQIAGGGVPAGSRHAIVAILACLTGITEIVIPAIFLFFYSRKSVRDTCVFRGPVQPARPAGSLPVAVTILTIWQAFAGVAVLFCLWIKSQIIFGVVLHGVEALLLTLALSAICIFAAVLIYKRRLAGWVIALCYAIFSVASAAVTFTGHNAAGIFHQMGELGAVTARDLDLLQRTMSIFWIFGLVYLIIFVGFLFHTHKYFTRSDSSAGAGEAAQ